MNRRMFVMGGGSLLAAVVPTAIAQERETAHAVYFHSSR
jgi:hypothetical protein